MNKNEFVLYFNKCILYFKNRKKFVAKNIFLLNRKLGQSKMKIFLMGKILIDSLIKKYFIVHAFKIKARVEVEYRFKLEKCTKRPKPGMGNTFLK